MIGWAFLDESIKSLQRDEVGNKDVRDQGGAQDVETVLGHAFSNLACSKRCVVEFLAFRGITFDKAFIGSCTNGSYDDLLQAALILRAARDAGRDKAVREFVIFPGSGGSPFRCHSRIAPGSKSRKGSDPVDR